MFRFLRVLQAMIAVSLCNGQMLVFHSYGSCRSLTKCVFCIFREFEGINGFQQQKTKTQCSYGEFEAHEDMFVIQELLHSYEEFVDPRDNVI